MSWAVARSNHTPASTKFCLASGGFGSGQKRQIHHKPGLTQGCCPCIISRTRPIHCPQPRSPCALHRSDSLWRNATAYRTQPPRQAGVGFGLGSGSPVWFWPEPTPNEVKLRRKQGPTGEGVPNLLKRRWPPERNNRQPTTARCVFGQLLSLFCMGRAAASRLLRCCCCCYPPFL